MNETASRQAGFRLDHIVIAVADLEQAIADYRKLGFTVYPGGTHHGGASHNALVVFADGSYFELIAYLKPSPDVRWWKLLSSSGEGFVDFALESRKYRARCGCGPRARARDRWSR